MSHVFFQRGLCRDSSPGFPPQELYDLKNVPRLCTRVCAHGCLCSYVVVS